MSDLPAFLSPILEDLASLRSSSARKLRALHLLDGLLATLCIPKLHETKEDERERMRVLRVFVEMQDGMEGNVVSRLLPLIARLLPILHSQVVQKESDEVISSTLTELSAVLQVAQGLCLLHSGSKDLAGKRSSMEVILDLFSLTRHLPASTQPEASSSSSGPPPTPLASSLLDTLFCALADSPINTRIFEEAGGLETVMKVLKKHGVRKDVRMKCLEFLIFYLLPEPSTPTSPSFSEASLPRSISLSPLPPSPRSSTSQASTPHQDSIVLPSPSQPAHCIPRTPTRRDASFLLGPQAAPRAPSSSSKHLGHGLGISSSFEHLGTPSHPAPPLSSPSYSRRASSSHSAETSDAENYLPPSSPSRRALASSQSITTHAAPKQPRTPSRHQAHGLGISHSHPPTSSVRPTSRSSSLSKPLQPSIATNPSLETFIPQTPTKRRDGTDLATSHGVPRTPSRYRIKEDEETEPKVLKKGRVASLSVEGILQDSPASPPTVAKTSSEGKRSEGKRSEGKRRESGPMLPPAQRSVSGSSSFSTSSPRTFAPKHRSSTPSFRLQPPPPPSPSHQGNHSPTSSSTTSLTPRRPSSSASHPSPLLPMPRSPTLSASPSQNHHSPNLNPSTPTKQRKARSSTKPFELSPSKRVPATGAEGAGGTTRSVAEKKALLGTFMANVDSLMGALGGGAELGRGSKKTVA